MTIASELSEQIIQAVSDKEWSKVLRLTDEARREQLGDGRRHCTQPEYPEVWVKFRDRGYPFSLRKDYDEAPLTDMQAIVIVLGYVEEWMLSDMAGQPVLLPANGARKPELLGNVDEMIVAWIIREFGAVRRELMRPRKN